MRERSIAAHDTDRIESMRRQRFRENAARSMLVK
jgi:hypothetical protein